MLDARDKLEDYFNQSLDLELNKLENIFTRVNDWMDKTFSEWQRGLDLNDAILDFNDTLMEYTGAYNANDLSMQEAVRLGMYSAMEQGQRKLDNNVAQHNAYGVAIEDAEKVLNELKKNVNNVSKHSAEEWTKIAEDAEAAGDMVKAAEARMWADFGAGAVSIMETQISEWRNAQADLLTEIVASEAELLQIAQDNIEKEKELAKKNIGTILDGLFTDITDLAENYGLLQTENTQKFDDYD